MSEDVQDCASIPGVDDVECRAGKCVGEYPPSRRLPARKTTDLD